MKALGYITAFISLIAVGTVARGFVFATLWEWFAVTQLAAPALSLAAATGLSTLIAFATFQMQPARESFSRVVAESVAVLLLYYPLILLIGLIVKSFL